MRKSTILLVSGRGWLMLLLAASPQSFGMDCARVAGDRIFGRDLAHADPDFAAMDPGLDLGPAPLVGATRVFPRWELVNLARRYSVPVPDEALARICMERASEPLTAEGLLPVLESALAAAGAAGHPASGEQGKSSLAVVDFSRTPLPLGTLEFRSQDLGANGFWRGRLRDVAGRTFPVWAQVKRIANPVPAGQPLAEQERAGPALLPPAVSSRPVATNAPARTPLASKREVERGRSVEVQVARGAVRLGLEATAEASGHVGETVVVRNPVTGHRFRAVVVGEGKVEVRP